MSRKIALLILALVATAAASLSTFTAPAEAACKKICCPGYPQSCVTCCQAPCPTIVCPP